MATRVNESEAISGGRSPPNQVGKSNSTQASGSTTHQTISTQVRYDLTYNNLVSFYKHYRFAARNKLIKRSFLFRIAEKYLFSEIIVKVRMSSFKQDSLLNCKIK